MIEAVSEGAATVTFTIEDEFGKTEDVSYTYKAVTDRYSIELPISGGKALPGESVTLEAQGEHDNYKDEDDLNDFSFKWVVTVNEQYVDSIENLTGNGSKAKVKIKKDISAEDLENEPNVFGRAYIVDKDGNVQEDVFEEFEINIRSSYYVYKPADEDVPSRPDIGETVKFEPRVFEKSLVNGEVEEKELTGFVWTVSYEPEDMTIYDASGEIVTSDEEFDSDEDMVYSEGSFTAERKAIDGCYFGVTFYYYNEEWEEYEQFGSTSYYFEGFEDLADADVLNIKNKTWTGNALTQAAVLYYWGDELQVNKDYKVSYKNNKNVGTATVTFTGIGDFRGTIKSTFKINPKGTSLYRPTAGKRSFTAKWKKQATQTTGYQIQYGLKSNFKGAKTKTIKGAKTVKTTIKSLKSKKYYYVRIRTYKAIGKTKYYSAWSKAQKVRTK